MAEPATLNDVCAMLAAVVTELKDLKTQIHGMDKRVSNIETVLTPPNYTAGEEVANVFELLEAILLLLPMRTLLLAQRVSRGFKDVIDGSDALQRALFFKKEPPLANLVDLPALNPLLGDHMHYRLIPLTDYWPSNIHPQALKLLTHVTNDNTQTFLAPTVCKVVHGGVKRYVQMEFEAMSPEFTPQDVRWQPKQYAHGSWRRMLVSQPPCGFVIRERGITRWASTGVERFGDLIKEE